MRLARRQVEAQRPIGGIDNSVVSLSVRLGYDPCNDLHPFFCAGGLLMHAHNRRGDYLNVAVAGLDDCIHQPVPRAGLGPAVDEL